MRRRLVAACLGALAALARADEPDLSALSLADALPETVAPASDWRTFIEVAYGGGRWRDGAAAPETYRLSLDVQYEHAFSPDWRLMLADRLDADWPAQGLGQNGINTLKEAYLSWRMQENAAFDFGRINARYGVATGYSPTDYFRAGALRSIVSVNPASLRENRQGSVMGRAQWLWEHGSLTAIYSPRLAEQADPDAFSPNWGATNNRDRWLLALGQRLGDNLSPQLLIYREGSDSPQLGLNLTGLVNDATVAFFEWSGGRSPSLLSQALAATGIPAAEDGAFRNRLSTGLTFTSSNKITLTGELEFNGGGLSEADWNALRAGSPVVYGLYRHWLQGRQDLPTRRSALLHGVWQDALIPHLDLSAMLNVDLVDSSRRSWLEACYHEGRSEYAVQWLRNDGQPLTAYGAPPQRRSWQLALRYYF